MFDQIFIHLKVEELPKSQEDVLLFKTDIMVPLLKIIYSFNQDIIKKYSNIKINELDDFIENGKYVGGDNQSIKYLQIMQRVLLDMSFDGILNSEQMDKFLKVLENIEKLKK